MKLRNVLALSTCAVLSISSSFAQQEATSLNSVDKKVFITVDADSVGFTAKKFGPRVDEVETKDGISVLRIDESALPWLSMLMHKEFKRCGGFMLHDDEQEALLQADSAGLQALAQSNFFAAYTVTRQDEVKPLVDSINKTNIVQTITKLSSFENRYYKGPFGKSSATWIKDYWTSLVKGRTDASVEFFAHSKWDQPSVVLTLKGQSDEMIILGGHQDSINMRASGSTARAPGADDNASGIATVTEVIRALMDSNYRPTKTIKFMAYAAEEVGLLGSKEIASSYKKNNANVIGVMQLDMTNFKGSDQFDIVMMTDYTNAEQNKFVGTLIDTYLPGVKWGYDKCGYGCSDHASWFTQGYPTTMPFEAQMKKMNGNIHSANDTLANSSSTGDQAFKFAKLGVAFVVELDK